MGKGKPASPEKRAHLNQLKRRSKLERKAEAGTITETERSELAKLPPRKPGGGGRPRKDPPLHGRGVDNAAQEPQTAAHTGDGASAQDPPSVEAPSPPPIGFPPPEPPPAVEVLPRTSGDWRGKYRQSMGREGTCVQIAMMYCGMLKRMSAYVEREGGKPIMSADQIDQLVLPCAVLTADALLPADFEMRPEHEVTIYSGLIIGQAASRALASKRKAPQSPRPRVVPPPPPEPPPHANGVRPTEPPDPAAATPPPTTNVTIDDNARF